MTDLPACNGLAELFEATDRASHLVARGLCSTCPVIGWCRGELAAARRDQIVPGAKYGPRGTWAGVLVGALDRRSA